MVIVIVIINHDDGDGGGDDGGDYDHEYDSGDDKTCGDVQCRIYQGYDNPGIKEMILNPKQMASLL